MPQDGNIRLEDLDIKTDGVVTYCYGEDSLACPEAKLRGKPKAKLGLEKYLTLWIMIAVGVGIGIGQLPGIEDAFQAMKVGNTNFLTAVGMIIMLLPPFAAVKYDEFWSSISNVPKRIVFASLFVNWIVGPFLMLFLGLLVLFDHPELLQGVIFIGSARCIAMVIVWTALADGDSFLCVSLVLLNSSLTIVLYSPIVALL